MVETERMKDARERRERIWERRQQGEIYRSIGDDYGISIERVRQLVKQHERELQAASSPIPPAERRKVKRKAIPNPGGPTVWPAMTTLRLTKNVYLFGSSSEINRYRSGEQQTDDD